MAEDGVGVERGGRETAAGGGGGGCWEDTWDEGGTPPTPWGEAVEARCRGDDSPPATTKNTRDRVNTSSHTQQMAVKLQRIAGTAIRILIAGHYVSSVVTAGARSSSIASWTIDDDRDSLFRRFVASARCP